MWTLFSIVKPFFKNSLYVEICDWQLYISTIYQCGVTQLFSYKNYWYSHISTAKMDGIKSIEEKPVQVTYAYNMVKKFHKV